MEKQRKAKKLLTDINKKIDSWNERSMFTLRGIKNLSMSDMLTIQLYAETILRQGNYFGLSNPIGKTFEVLSKYELI